MLSAASNTNQLRLGDSVYSCGECATRGQAGPFHHGMSHIAPARLL
jgi:hypothetical protein